MAGHKETKTLEAYVEAILNDETEDMCICTLKTFTDGKSEEMEASPESVDLKAFMEAIADHERAEQRVKETRKALEESINTLASCNELEVYQDDHVNGLKLLLEHKPGWRGTLWLMGNDDDVKDRLFDELDKIVADLDGIHIKDH